MHVVIPEPLHTSGRHALSTAAPRESLPAITGELFISAGMSAPIMAKHSHVHVAESI
jgi:hypothetical protein